LDWNTVDISSLLFESECPVMSTVGAE